MTRTLEQLEIPASEDTLSRYSRITIGCWVDPRHLSRPADLRIDYEIEALTQLEALLENV